MTTTLVSRATREALQAGNPDLRASDTIREALWTAPTPLRPSRVVREVLYRSGSNPATRSSSVVREVLFNIQTTLVLPTQLCREMLYLPVTSLHAQIVVREVLFGGAVRRRQVIVNTN